MLTEKTTEKKLKKIKKSVDKRFINWYSERALTLIVIIKIYQRKKSIKKLKKVLTN